jgi:hypothetical protein
MKRAFLAALAVTALCGCASTSLQTIGQSVRSVPLGYNAISTLIESRAQVTSVYLLGFQRDSIGSKLFIKFKFRKGNKPMYRTLVVTGAGIREISGYPKLWYDDQENLVFRLEGYKEWYEGKGRSTKFFSKWDDASFVFKSGGAVIPYKEATVSGVLGGDFVLVQFKKEIRPPQRVHIRGTNYVTIEYSERTPWIVSSPENPRQPLIELPKDFEPSDAYANGNRRSCSILTDHKETNLSGNA